jgi:hypothetical protein
LPSASLAASSNGLRKPNKDSSKTSASPAPPSACAATTSLRSARRQRRPRARALRVDDGAGAWGEGARSRRAMRVPVAQFASARLGPAAVVARA